MIILNFFTSLAKGGYVFGTIALSVCGHYSKSYEWILIKVCGVFLGSTMKN